MQKYKLNYFWPSRTAVYMYISHTCVYFIVQARESPVKLSLGLLDIFMYRESTSLFPYSISGLHNSESGA